MEMPCRSLLAIGILDIGMDDPPLWKELYSQQSTMLNHWLYYYNRSI